MAGRVVYQAILASSKTFSMLSKTIFMTWKSRWQRLVFTTIFLMRTLKLRQWLPFPDTCLLHLPCHVVATCIPAQPRVSVHVHTLRLILISQELELVSFTPWAKQIQRTSSWWLTKRGRRRSKQPSLACPHWPQAVSRLKAAAIIQLLHPIRHHWRQTCQQQLSWELFCPLILVLKQSSLVTVLLLELCHKLKAKHSTFQGK